MKMLNLLPRNLFFNLSLFIGFFLFVTNSSVGQIAIQDFEASPATPTMTYTGGDLATGNGSFPSDAKYVSGSQGREVNNATTDIVFANVNTSGYTGITFSVRLASFAGTSGNGADGADYADVYVSDDGGTTWSNELSISGNSNAKWSFITGTGVATTAYDGDNSSTNFSPSGGGNRTTDGYSYLSVSGLPATTNLRVKIEIQNNSGNEYWVVDDATITGTIAGPTITTNTLTLTGFDYVVSAGPSAEQSFTVEGASLTNDILVTPPTNWEISTVSGGPYQTTAITLAESGGIVASTSIYTRLVSGLALNSYSGNISCTSTGATTVDIAVDGTVTTPPPPTIIVAPSSLTGFSYAAGSGPSSEQTFTVEGSNLTNDIDVTPPTNWEISTISGGPYQTTAITLSESGGIVANTTLYTRMVSGLAVNSYSGNIASSSTGASTQNVAVDGTVTLGPTGCSTVFSDDFSSGLTAWTNTSDWTTLSGELKHDLSGVSGSSYIYSDLGSQDLTLNDYEWEVCLSNGNWDPSSANKFAFFLISDALNLLNTPDGYAVGVNQNGSSDALVLYSVNGGVYTSIITTSFLWDSNDDVCIRVTRTAAGAWEIFYDDNGAGEVSGGTTSNTTFTSGQYVGPTFNFSSTRAGLLYIDDVVVCGAASPTINTSTSSLTGFTYVVAAGPSAEQSFTVDGINLTNDIDVTPPTNWEISTVSGGPYQTTALTLTQTGGTVASTTIYTRMVSGLAVNSYNGDITCSSTGASNDDVAVDGTVTNPPTPVITVTPASLTGFTYAFGSGPSAEQSFAVDGANLTADIDVTPPTNWEISTVSGGPYQTTPITLAESGGTVASTTIYTRMVSGLAAGSYSGNISSSTTGASNEDVAVDGTVVPLCVAPSAQPTVLIYPAVTHNQIDGSFTASSPAADEYLVVQSTNATLSGNPTDGTSYIVGASLGGGTVVQSSSSLSFTDTGLIPTTTYYYFVFAYNNIACSGGPAYLIASPLSNNTTTLDAPCIEEGFVDFSDWVDNGTAVSTNSSHYGVASPCRALGSFDDLVSPSVDYPHSLEFYQDASGGGNGSSATVEYQIGTNGWVLFHTFTVTSSGQTESIDLTTLGVDLSLEYDVTFRFSSTFSTWYLDDVVVECSQCVPSHTITSFAPNSGPVGTEVTINGTGFTASSIVRFNGTIATVISQTSTEIVAEVLTGSTTGELSVTEDNCILLSTVYTVNAASGICYGGTGFTDVYISEVYDSESGNLGFIELHNPTGAAIDLDLPGAGYFLRIDNNNDTVIDIDVDLTGTIAANGTLVVQLGSGTTCNPITVFSGPASGINDDDIIYLERNGTYIDRADTPSELGYTMERNGEAVGPTTTFDSDDWISSSSESCSGLGNPTTVFPSISILFDQNICEPNFSVTATAGAGGTLTYEWFYNDGSAWVTVNATNLPGLTLSGETTNSLTLSVGSSDISSIDGYQFYVEVTEGGTCSDVSNIATFTDPGGCFDCANVVVDVILDANFNDGDISAWTQSTSGEWGSYDGTQDTPFAAVLNGTNSVRQYLDINTDTESSFRYDYDDCIEGVSTSWKFQMYNNSNPSLNDYFLVYLTNNSETTTTSTGTGYAIGVKPSVFGDHDFIELFKVVDGVAVETIINTGIAWQSTAHGDPYLTNNKVGIEVTRSETGVWGVKLDVDGGLDNLVSYGAPATNTDFNFSESFVVYRKHTGGNENTIMIDDVNISQTGCDILYYSQSTGNVDGVIWAELPVGTAQDIVLGRFTRLVIQDSHTVTLNQDMICDDLTLSSTGVLDAQDKMICIYGDFLNTGTYTPGTSTISFNGKGVVQNVVSSSSLSFYNMISDNPVGVTTSSDLVILNGLFPEEGNFNYSGGSLTLKSDASGTGSVGEIKTGATLTGDVTLERFISADTGTDVYPGGWVGLGTPIENKTIADWNADLITTGFPGSDYPNYAYENNVLFNNIINFNSGAWVNAVGLGDVLSDERGYFVYMGAASATTHMTGTFAQGDQTTALDFGSGNFNLVVNPYPCPVNWDLVYANSTDVNPTYYLFDSDANVYKTYNAASQTGTAGNIIAASQSVFVISTSASASLDWKESYKVVNGTDAWERTDGQFEGFSLILNQNSEIDQCFIGFHESASDVYDLNYDSYKMAIPFPETELYTISTVSADDITLQDNIQYNESDELIVPVKIDAEFNSEYNLTFDGLQFVEDRCIVLEDLYTGESYTITEGFEYSFIVNEEIENRFLIHITNEVCDENVAAVSVDEINNSLLNVFNTNESLTVSSTELLEDVTLKIINTIGQEVSVFNINKLESSQVFDISKLNKGVYFVIIQYDTKTVYSSKHIK